MADTVESRMNLAALQRLDPYITSIVATASQVALYQFSSKTSEWEKTEIEGTLFVYSRCAKPWHGLIIMNRLNRENLIEPLNKAMEFQRQDPFLLYRNAKMVIYGIWFYNQADSFQIHATMNQLTANLNEKSNEKKNSNQQLQSNNTTVTENSDIVTMLVQAQNVYNKTSETPAKTSEPKLMTESAMNASELVRPRAVRPISSAGIPPDVTNGTNVASTSLSVAALFANAEKMQQAPLIPVHQGNGLAKPPIINKSGLSLTETRQESTAEKHGDQNLIPVLQRLFSHPEHSAELPIRNASAAEPKSQTTACRTPSSENLLKKLQLIQVEDQSVSERGGKTDDSKMGLSIDEEPHEVEEIEKRISPILPCSTTLPLPPFPSFDLLPPLSPPAPPMLPLPTTIMGTVGPLLPITPTDPSKSIMGSGMGYLSATPPRSTSLADVPLMSPMMFASPRGQVKPEFGNEMQLKVSDKMDMSTTSFTSLSPLPTLLTKDQLLQAMEYLLKNDPEFVTKIHAAYIKCSSMNTPLSSFM